MTKKFNDFADKPSGNVKASDSNTDDPVRIYLREMGKTKLLKVDGI